MDEHARRQVVPLRFFCRSQLMIRCQANEYYGGIPGRNTDGSYMRQYTHPGVPELILHNLIVCRVQQQRVPRSRLSMRLSSVVYSHAALDQKDIHHPTTRRRLFILEPSLLRLARLRRLRSLSPPAPLLRLTYTPLSRAIPITQPIIRHRGSPMEVSRFARHLVVRPSQVHRARVTDPTLLLQLRGLLLTSSSCAFPWHRFKSPVSPSSC